MKENQQSCAGRQVGTGDRRGDCERSASAMVGAPRVQHGHQATHHRAQAQTGENNDNEASGWRLVAPRVHDADAHQGNTRPDDDGDNPDAHLAPQSSAAIPCPVSRDSRSVVNAWCKPLHTLRVRMRKRLVAVTVCGLALCAAMSPAALADGLGGISGFAPATSVCGYQYVMPLTVANGTNQVQVASITAGSSVANEVSIAAASNGNAGPVCLAPMWDEASGYSYNATVNPGQVLTFYVAMGGEDRNLIEGRVFSIGGLPSDTPGQAWYDFKVVLNADEGFESLNPYYDNTGGTDWSTSHQNGFNIVQCGSNNLPTATVLSSFTTRTANLNPITSGQALCMAWLPNGQFTEFQTTQMQGPSTVNVLATQVGGFVNGATLLGVAGALPNGVQLVNAYVTPSSPTTTPPAWGSLGSAVINNIGVTVTNTGNVTTLSNGFALEGVPYSLFACGTNPSLTLVASDGSMAQVVIEWPAC